MSSAERAGGARAYRLPCGEPLTSPFAPHRESPPAEMARASEPVPGLVPALAKPMVPRPKPTQSNGPAPGSASRELSPDLHVDQQR